MFVSCWGELTFDGHISSVLSDTDDYLQNVVSHLVDCFQAAEFNSSVCEIGGSGEMELNSTREMKKRDAGDDVMKDYVLDSHGSRMRRDLVEFVRKHED